MSLMAILNTVHNLFSIFLGNEKVMSKLLTPKVKSWVMQIFLTSDSMNGTLKCDHLLESCGSVC